MRDHFWSDDRAVMIPVAHVMTIAITTILIIALLIGAAGLLDDQRESATREELRTVGNRLSTDIARVDALAQRGGAANVTSKHTGEIAGSRYTVSLLHGSACDTNRFDADTCLELSTVETDATQFVAVHNDTEIHLRVDGPGIFHVNGTAQATTADSATWDQLDLQTRIGIGRDVRPSNLLIGGAPGNHPPEAEFRPRPGSPQANQPLEFDATGSRDPDGSIQTYFWDFDDDGSYEISTGSPTIDHPLGAGTYNVTLKVKDNEGQTHNTTRFIDVSGLVYNQDLDVHSGDDNVRFTVTNNFGTSVDLTHVSIDPRDNSIDYVYNGGNPEIFVDASNDGYLDDTIWFADGGKIRELDNDARLDAGSTATIYIRGFEDPVKGKRLNLALQYVYRGIPNSTSFSDVPGGPSISNYGLTAAGTNVDLSFESTKQLDDVSIELGGDVSTTIDETDLTETTSGGNYVYEYDVSDGTTGYFWANMTTAQSGGVPSGDVPINDSVVTTTSSLSWTTASDWDGASSASGIVHASYGDHADDELQLGYPTFDQGGSNLVGYWPLDSNTSAPDESGTGNDGNVQGNPRSAVGLFGTDAYDLDGSSDHVVIPDDSSIGMAAENEVTVSSWVYKDQSQGGWTAIFQHSDRSYNLQFNNDEPEFTIYDGGTWYSAVGGTQLPSGQWYHLVGTFDGSTIDLYVDGSLSPYSGSASNIEPTNFDAGIGENLDASGRHFDGKIDEVRLYDRALDATEVDDLYRTHERGRLTTGWKIGSSIDANDVELQYNAEIDTGETVRVRVHSRNGSIDQSNWVTLSDGPGTVAVPGLSQDAAEYRLEVELRTNDPSHAPSVSTLQVVDGS